MNLGSWGGLRHYLHGVWVPADRGAWHFGVLSFGLNRLIGTP